MTEESNPIRRIRMAQGLSQLEFAQKYNVILRAILLLERGKLDHVPFPLVGALIFDGLDGDAIAEDYLRWLALYRVAPHE